MVGNGISMRRINRPAADHDRLSTPMGHHSIHVTSSLCLLHTSATSNKSSHESQRVTSQRSSSFLTSRCDIRGDHTQICMKMVVKRIE